ncbi:MAG TPA: M20/M25/M40 family metallo-hydrolase [Gemmatimonadales bacterium]|nr:M20/M25/M40 family metallo-hydrolase [Gemmatimonadales bacterium]
MIRSTALLLAVVTTAAAAQRPAPSLPIPNARAMDAHLRYLADDLLEGRGPGTRGGMLAVKYIAAQFEAMGLEPAGPDGSFFQSVALVGMKPQPTFWWSTGTGAHPLAYGDDFVAWAETPDSAVAVGATPVVFVGYGIQSPEWQWDDYKGIDTKGKVLLMLVNDPGLQDSTIFNGRALTYYGRWTYKLEQGARMGAAAVILIHTPQSATYPWSVVKGSWSVEQFKLDQPQSPSLTLAGWIAEGAARTALAAAGFNLDSLMHAAARRDFRPVNTGLTADIAVKSVVRHIASANVVARLPGSDAALSQQVVLLSAHWDHKGIGPVVNGDSIYNGAEDNASGVAAMLATAQALTQVQPRPKRSLMFIATTAEESGLLGSETYAEHPLVPLAQTAAILNIDGANVRGRTRDIAALGIERSSLGAVFRRAAAAEGLTPTGDPDASKGSFFRSDHFPLARAGVPGLSFTSGIDFVGRPRSWGREQNEKYNSERYHQPADEYSRDFTYEGMVQEARVMMRVAIAVANAPTLPTWLPTAEFKRSPGM